MELRLPKISSLEMCAIVGKLATVNPYNELDKLAVGHFVLVWDGDLADNPYIAVGCLTKVTHTSGGVSQFAVSQDLTREWSPSFEHAAVLDLDHCPQVIISRKKSTKRLGILIGVTVNEKGEHIGWVLDDLHTDTPYGVPEDELALLDYSSLSYGLRHSADVNVTAENKSEDN